MIKLYNPKENIHFSNIFAAKTFAEEFEKNTIDYSINPKKDVFYDESGRIGLDGGDLLPLSKTAMGQLFNKAKIPQSFANRIPSNLLKTNIDRLLPSIESDNWIFKTARCPWTNSRYIRGIVSERYQELKDSEVLLNTINRINESSNVVEKWDISFSSDMMRTTGIFPKEIRPTTKVGDITKMGIEIINGNTGITSFSVKNYLYRLVCSNGMVVPEEIAGNKFKHIGSDFEIKTGKGFYSVFNNAERISLLWSNSCEMSFAGISRSLSNRVFNKVQLIIGKKESLELFNEAQEKTIYEVLNNITARARDITNISQRSEMESIAGELLLAA